jgi:hypothetical protein
MSQKYRFSFSVYPSHGTRQETHLPVVVVEETQITLFLFGVRKSETEKRPK